MKIHWYLLLFITLGYSCSKQNNEEINTEKKDALQSVTFTFDGFTQTINPLATLASIDKVGSSNNNAAASKTYIQAIDCYVYNSSGALTKSFRQSLKTPGFGTLTMELPYGDYSLIAVGSADSTKSVVFSSYVNQIGQTQLDTYSKEKSIDIFKSEVISFNVAAGSSNNNNITLARTVAKFECIIVDTVPTTVTSIKISYKNLAFPYLGQPFGSYQKDFDESFSTSSLVGKAGNKLQFYTPVQTSMTSDVTLTAYDKNAQIVYGKTVKNVTFERNKVTSISGKLFQDPTGQAGADINYDETFDPNGHTQPY